MEKNPGGRSYALKIILKGGSKGDEIAECVMQNAEKNSKIHHDTGGRTDRNPNSELGQEADFSVDIIYLPLTSLKPLP